MPVASVPDFLEIWRTSRLLNSAQLDEITRAFPGQPSDLKALARELVQRGWLTAWHVNHFVGGRSAALVLGSIPNREADQRHGASPRWPPRCRG
jgi:hypothetical protein